MMLVKVATVVGNWFIPIFLLTVFLHGIYKKVPVFDSFIEGAKEGLTLAIRILPYVVAIYVAVGMFRSSGALDLLVAPIKPVIAYLGVPAEILPLIVVRLFSGPAALGITSNLFDKFGPDSFIGRLASTLDGSTDTVLYIMAVYFASVGIKNTRYALPVGLIGAFSGFISSLIICKILFAG